MAVAPGFEISRIVGSGQAQELVCATIPLPVATAEIKQIQKTVLIDNCRVIFGKVIIDGRLRKDITLTAPGVGFPQPGIVQGCGGVTFTAAGPFTDLVVDVSFTALIPVPGADPTLGDRCVVLSAFVEGEKEEAAGITPAGLFTSLIDKSVIFLCVKVIRDAAVTGLPLGVDEGTSEQVFCTPRRSTGFFPGSTTIPAATPGLLPGTFVGPTLIFPGVLNPGVPVTLPPTGPALPPTSSVIEITPPAPQLLG